MYPRWYPFEKITQSWAVTQFGLQPPAIWIPFWYLLVNMSMNPVNAGVITLAIAGFFNMIFFEPLFAVAHYFSVTVIALAFAVLIFLASFPLLIFRIFPIGYLSAAGLLFAALGAYRHISG